MVSRITVFTTYPGGDFTLDAQTLAELMGGGGGSGGDIISTPITTVGNGTLTAAALVGGLVVRTGPTGAFTDTTDSAANIVAALSGTQFLSGETFYAYIKNGTQYTQTLAAGAGVTLPSALVIPGFSIGQYFGTIGGTAASPTVTFTHISTVAIRTSDWVSNPQAVALNTVGAGTVLAAAVAGGVTTRGGVQTGAFIDTTDNAADLIAGIPGLSAVGASVPWRYVNNTIDAATLEAGSGVTLTNTVIPANSWADFLVTYSGTGAVTMVCTGQGYFPSSGTFVINGVTPVTVTNAAVTAGSNISITLKTVGGTVGAIPHVETITPGTGFTVIGTASDSSTYNYEIRG